MASQAAALASPWKFAAAAAAAAANSPPNPATGAIAPNGQPVTSATGTPPPGIHPNLGLAELSSIMAVNPALASFYFGRNFGSTGPLGPFGPHMMGPISPMIQPPPSSAVQSSSQPSSSIGHISMISGSSNTPVSTPSPRINTSINDSSNKNDKLEENQKPTSESDNQNKSGDALNLTFSSESNSSNGQCKQSPVSPTELSNSPGSGMNLGQYNSKFIIK